MKCEHCNGEILPGQRSYSSLKRLFYHFEFCSPKAERSEVLQGCPPSAMGSDSAATPEAEAVKSQEAPMANLLPAVERKLHPALISSDVQIPVSDSETWPHVLLFAKRMEAKLAKNRHKGDRLGWLNVSPEELLDLLKNEVRELDEAFDDGDAVMVANECADVANFALMVADWFTEHAKVNVSDDPTAGGSSGGI